MLREKLEEFREILTASDPEAAAALRPGLPREHVEERLAELPFRITPDAVDLYCWADGNDNSLVEILPSGYYRPFNDAIDLHLHLAPIYEEYPDWDPYRKQALWFLHDMSDAGYAFGGLDSPSKGAIVSLEIHHPATLGFATLEHLVDTAIACRNRGVFRSDDDVDWDLYYVIARELNPGMSAWEPFEG